MDSFELNKIIAAVLMVALLVIGLGKIADGIFHVKKPKNPGYQIEVENQLASDTSQVALVEEKIDIAAIMALGDTVSGEKIFKSGFPGNLVAAILEGINISVFFIIKLSTLCV